MYPRNEDDTAVFEDGFGRLIIMADNDLRSYDDEDDILMDVDIRDEFDLEYEKKLC